MSTEHYIASSMSENPPSIQEKSDVRLLVDNYTNELNSIQTEILRLEARKLELTALIDKHQAMLNPKSHSRQPADLPEDVWAEIFTRCIPTDSPPVPNVIEAPLLLTTVCRSWREIALSTPSLWASISVILPPLPRTRPYASMKEVYRHMVKGRIEGIRNWLDRSGALPIRLAVRDLPPHCEFPMSDVDHVPELHRQTFQDFANVLFSYSPRYSEVVVDSAADALHAYRVGPIRGIGSLKTVEPLQLPLLRVLDVPFAPNDLEIDFHWRFLVSPSIRELVLRAQKSHHAPFHAPGLPLPLNRGLAELPVKWSSLTRLELHRTRSLVVTATWTDILPMLALCPRLQSFSATGIHQDHDPEVFRRTVASLQTPIRLADLHCLRVGIDVINEEVFRLFFGALLTPSLSDLTLHWHDHPRIPRPIAMDHRVVIDFMTRSSCKLSSLSVRFPIPETSLVELLKSIPTLSFLDVHEIRQFMQAGREILTITRLLLEALSPEASVCPNLERLTLTMYRWRPDNRKAVSSFARAWKDEAEAKLKSVTVKWADVQPVREPIENVLDEDPEALAGWKPVWNYVEHKGPWWHAV